MNGKKIGIGQLEVVDLSIFDEIKDDLLKDIQALKEEENLDTVLLLLTDIIAMGSEVLVSSNDEDIVALAFDKTIVDGKFWLDGCLSRKKQVVPVLEPAFK
jgi:manganese-dependent inorganic pyrophosphatase